MATSPCMHGTRFVVGAVGLLAMVTGCGAESDGTGAVVDVPASSAVSAGRAARIVVPPPNVRLDYQLGGSYPPPPGVGIVSRDRTAAPAPGTYNICYVNGFQTQPGEADGWLRRHPDLLLRDADGTPVIDPEWPDEYILDISSRDRRAQLVEIVGAWIDDCASAGFQSVEIDNLDTFTRFPSRLREADAVPYARALADRAHAAGLAAGQKNASELVSRRDETTFDFAVVEQCSAYDECDAFTAGYHTEVFDIEYERQAFERGCADHPELSIVLRDVEVSTPGSPTYVDDAC